MNNKIITLDSALSYWHYGEQKTYDYIYGFNVVESFTVDFVAEVGLLSRNVKVVGAMTSENTENEYGAQVMLNSPGDENSVGRIEHVEFKHVGQAGQVGKYPINFHQLGAVHKSYIRNNSIWQSYNRGIAISGIHYLRVQDNTLYKIKGHAIFITSGTETSNLIERNLVAEVEATFSLLQTDTVPAAFYITNPSNFINGNSAVAADGSGFWYHLPDESLGAMGSTSFSPLTSDLGEFHDNTAHSNIKAPTLT